MFLRYVLNRNLEKGERNKLAIRHLLVIFPGITFKEIGSMLNLSSGTVTRHVKAIRKEWDANSLAEYKKAVHS